MLKIVHFLVREALQGRRKPVSHRISIMKRAIGPMFTALFWVFGAVLIFQKSAPERPPIVIHQASDRAILNLDPEWEAGLLDGSLKIELPGSNSKMLIRIDAADPVRLAIKLNESVEGQPFVVVSPKAKRREFIDLPPLKNDTTAEAFELKGRDGNIYALAIRNEGRVKKMAKTKLLPIPPKLFKPVKIKD